MIKEHRLVSKKKNTNGIHGLGIKNIQDVAGRYEGSVEMTYHSGRFISIVMLQGYQMIQKKHTK